MKKLTDKEQNEITNKLLDIYSKASTKQIKEGHTWYFKANLSAKTIKSKLALSGINISLSKIVGVISALSPSNKWHRNLLDAEMLLNNPLHETKVCTYNLNKLKAFDIMGSNIENEIYLTLGGLKTKSFYKNILNPITSKEVTIDLWMYRSAGLKQLDSNYKFIANSVRIIAEKNNVLPHQVQAVIWIVLRSSYEMKKKSA
jgi:hypothetical protein